MEVIRIRDGGVGVKWDFEVPEYGNYLHAGVFHHNSGKSETGIIHNISHCIGCHPDGSKENLPAPPVDLLMMVEDRRKAVDKIVMKKLNKYCAKEWVERVQPGTDGFPEIIHFSNGSRLYLGSYTQETRSHEGQEWHAVHFDEPPPRKLWITIRRGLLDHGGRAWFTLTPLSCPWIYNEIYKKADGKRIATFHLDLLDNPHIGKAEKDAFMKDLTPEEIEARVHGKFSHLSGAIFAEFRRDKHVVPQMSIPYGHTHYMSMDPHDRRPSYMFWMAVGPRGQMIIYDEWPNEPFYSIKRCKNSVRDYAALIHTKEGRNRVHERTGDPNFFKTPSVMTGSTLLEEFQDHGIDFFVAVNNDIALGHSRIHELLRTDVGEPGLVITENCRNMIEAFEQYSWNQDDMERESSAKERPSEYGKDMIDALRYLLDYGPTYVVPDHMRLDERKVERGVSGY